MQIQTCFSPSQLQFYELEDSIVVVTDIFRATSAMCTAFENGVEKLIPVAGIDEAITFQKRGFIVAAERDGKIVDGFELGNSPFDYMKPELKNKTIVISTTNGTQAIHAARKANKVVIGAFVNLSSLADFLSTEKKNILVLCAGWKNKFNLEDTLFAGALSNLLISSFQFQTDCDSTLAAMHLFKIAQPNLFSFLENSSHRNRLKNLHLENDIKYCLTPDSCKCIPVLVDDVLINVAAISVQS